MTHLAERAFRSVEQLSDSEQDFIAELLLSELDSDSAWRHSFAGSQDELAEMAREAREEYKLGKTLPLDPEAL